MPTTVFGKPIGTVTDIIQTKRSMLKTSDPVGYHHSWEGKVLHVSRQDGRVVRAIVGKLLFRPHEITCKMSYRNNTGTKLLYKEVSPLVLYILHKGWAESDILSDEEEDISEITESIPDEPDEQLGPLTIDDTLSTGQYDAFQSIHTQLEQLTLVFDSISTLSI